MANRISFRLKVVNGKEKESSSFKENRYKVETKEDNFAASDAGY